MNFQVSTLTNKDTYAKEIIYRAYMREQRHNSKNGKFNL